MKKGDHGGVTIDIELIAEQIEEILNWNMDYLSFIKDSTFARRRLKGKVHVSQDFSQPECDNTYYLAFKQVDDSIVFGIDETSSEMFVVSNTGFTEEDDVAVPEALIILMGTSKKPHLVLDSNFSAATALSKCSRSPVALELLPPCIDKKFLRQFPKAVS